VWWQSTTLVAAYQDDLPRADSLTLQGLDLVVHATEAGVDPPVHPLEGGIIERNLLLDRLGETLGVVQLFEGGRNLFRTASAR
jgi:hypothetical protein